MKSPKNSVALLRLRYKLKLRRHLSSVKNIQGYTRIHRGLTTLAEEFQWFQGQRQLQTMFPAVSEGFKWTDQDAFRDISSRFKVFENLSRKLQKGSGGFSLLLLGLL